MIEFHFIHDVYYGRKPLSTAYRDWVFVPSHVSNGYVDYE